MDEIFQGLISKSDLTGCWDEANEDTRLSSLLLSACNIYLRHLRLPDNIDAIVKTDTSNKMPAIHARMAFIFKDEGDKEKHYCIRGLIKNNANAFQNRLNAALTASGIDTSLRFRQLLIVRRMPPPHGLKTTQLVEKFQQLGGKWIDLSDEELKIILALQTMEKQHLDQMDIWLQTRQPLFQLRLFQEAGLCPPDFLKEDPPPPPPPPPPPTTSKKIPLGHCLAGGGRLASPVGLQTALLRRHTAILAGSGSGKTVLLRRLVEESALIGIPAIVLDVNNDLARLGDVWPESLCKLSAEDQEKARKYHQDTEVLLWTPGRSGGRDLILNTLPDFSCLKDNADELASAVDMASDALVGFVASTSSKDNLKRGVLKDAIRYFASFGGGKLNDLISILNDLPIGTSQITKSEKIAKDIADQLRAAISIDPRLSLEGQAIGVEELLISKQGKVRISIVNLAGLVSMEAKHFFVNQLQMMLFTWIKQNPSEKDRLYVMDETQNFAPSKGTTACKASTLTLVTQARKYGLGMIFATQQPKGIDNAIISNCTTHFYGRMNAPATIDAVKEMAAAKNGNVEDVGRLARGEFYFSTEDVPRPIKIQAPLCLSWHPESPLTEEQILAKAKR